MTTKLRSACQRCRPTSDAGDLHVAGTPWSSEQFLSSGLKRIHCIALQPRNLNWLVIMSMHNTCPFAEYFNGTRAGTAAAQNVRIEDAKRCAAQVARADALDKSGNVNVRWTRTSARRIEAVQSAIGFNHRSLRRARRLDSAEALAQ